jgi:hypothetical protein
MPIIIANNPDLTHLDVQGEWKRPEQMPSLLELVGEISGSSGPPLQLQHLGVGSHAIHLEIKPCPTCLDPIPMRHLKSLTSLKLHHHGESGTMPAGCNVPHIWDALFAEGVWLTALNTDCMDSKLFRYLASYSGLKILQLQWLDLVDDLANEFFCDILSHHANTLETLRLDPQFEGPWCLGPGNVESILQCHKLVELAFAMELKLWGKSQEEWEKEIEIHPVVHSPCVSLHYIFAHLKLGYHAQRCRTSPPSISSGIYSS